MDIRDVKKNLERRVLHKSRDGDSEYIFSGCILRKNKKTARFYYQAELRDIKHQNCLVYCDLTDLEVLEE